LGRDKEGKLTMGLGFIFLILVVLLAVYLLRPDLFKNLTRSTPSRKTSPLDILKERYARGEISREEYEEMKRDLMS
jgi:putative membrane protein